jgi:hypothetical protein
VFSKFSSHSPSGLKQNDKNKRAKPACALGPPQQALTNLKFAMISSGLERSDINERQKK